MAKGNYFGGQGYGGGYGGFYNAAPYPYGGYQPFMGGGMPQQVPNVQQGQQQPPMQAQGQGIQTPQASVAMDFGEVTTPRAMAYVNGFIGANAYIMMPNDCLLLMDLDNSMFYIKTSNRQGHCKIESYKFEKAQGENDIGVVGVDTQALRAEMDELKTQVETLKKEIGQKNEDDTL